MKYSSFVYITNTAAVTGLFSAIQAIGAAPAVLAAGTVVSGSSGAALNGMSIPAGDMIYGTFTAVQLASGACIAYKY